MTQKRKTKFYCTAYGCLNNDGNEDLSFFSLPKDAERRKKWLELLDRRDLLKKKDLRSDSHRVCSEHFEDSAYKKFLKRDAIPIQVSEGTNESQISSYPAATQACAQLKRRLSEELWSPPHKYPRLEQEISKINKELEGKNTPIMSEHSDDEISKRIQKLIEWQNKLKSRFHGNQYDLEYKDFSLNLYYANPHFYRLLQTVLKLPSKSTMKRFKIRIPPKLDDRVIKSLKFKMKALPSIAKYCTFCVDKITLKRNLYYDIKSDEVIGFQNINGQITPEVASNAYAIMLQGIHIKWQQPIAYALLASPEHYEELDLWLEQVLSKLSSIGIKIKALTSDQGSNFDKFAKEIKKVTTDKPYFTYDDKKIFYIFDVPHLILCICNNLITSDFHFGDKIISWKFIQQLYDDQKNKNLRLIPKITDAHIYPNNFQITQVEYATQVFSRTFSTALHAYIDFGIISEKARPTANFLETINNLFDVLNSSRLNCKNKYQNAYRKCNYQEQVLDDAYEMLSKIRTINKNTGKKNHMKSFINTQISIQSIKLLYEDLNNEGFKYIFTRRLNKGCLENFFGSIRQQSGSCNEPTPIQFQRAFSKLFISNMLESSTNAKCAAHLNDILLQAEDVMKTDNMCNPPTSEKSIVCLDGETDHRLDLPKENALTYVAGYLLFKCIVKHRCHNIDKALKSASDLGATNLFTNYKALNKPPQEFIKNIKKLEDVFTQNFEKAIAGNPGAKLYSIMQGMFSQTPCACFPLNYLLKLFIRLRIYATLKFNNRKLKDEKEETKHYLKAKHL